MLPDETHYQLHWEFFKSINPEADELFFIELQLERLADSLKELKQKVDFSNDGNTTIEDYENEQNRQQFFFDREYKQMLERKKEHFKALPPQQTEEPKPELKETELLEKIKKHLRFMLGNCPRKGTPILNNEKDFENLVKWTTYFFENNFEVPEISEPIQSVNTNIYITQLAFHILFDELRKSGFHNQRRKAKALFNLWKSCFANYKGYAEKNFWKVKKINKDTGFSYENDVKKRMQIDY